MMDTGMRPGANVRPSHSTLNAQQRKAATTAAKPVPLVRRHMVSADPSTHGLT
jgi:hypothetical protein